MKFITEIFLAVIVLFLITEAKSEWRTNGTSIINVYASWRFGINKNNDIIYEPADLIAKGTLYFNNNHKRENAFNAGLRNFAVYERTEKGNYYNLNYCRKFKKLKKRIEEPFLIVYKDSGIILGLKFNKDETELTKSLKYTFASYIQLDLRKLKQENKINVILSTEEKTPLGSCAIEYNAHKHDLPNEKVEYNIMKNLVPNGCTRENKSNTFPEFCKALSKVDEHSIHNSKFSASFKDKTFIFQDSKHDDTANIIPLNDTSNTFNAFITLDMELKRIVQKYKSYPQFKNNDAKLISSLQVPELNKSILAGKTGKNKKLQNVYRVLSCLNELPTSYDSDIIELVLQCEDN